MKVYLDNAATTVLDPQVWETMEPYFLKTYGNPSSTHYAGREAKASIELARKKIADSIGTKSSRVIFTSGATEANNLVFKFAKRELEIQKIIVSPLEHHAVLYPAQILFEKDVLYTKHDKNGVLDLNHLENLVSQHNNALVSIMHVNNEIGIINPVAEIAKICDSHNTLFHSDTVQSLAHLPVNIKEIGFDFIVSSAHKYHGPKGIGFLAFGQDFKLKADTYGGVQEKSLRAGTEAVPLIVGMAKALELTIENLETVEQQHLELKSYLIEKLTTIQGISYHAGSDNLTSNIPSLLNISLPSEYFNSMTLFNLDLKGIAISGGSACSSGAIKGSHVLETLDPENETIALRVSFSKYTTQQELDYFVEMLTESQQR